MEKTKELVFIPGPGLGHLISAVETGRKILGRHQYLSITYLLIDMVPNDKALYNYTQSLSSATTPRLRFTNLSRTQPDCTQELNLKNPSAFVTEFICSQKPLVREAVLEIIKFESSQVVGFMVDLFCVSMIDVADEFKIPSYVFFTSSAGFLSVMLRVQTITDEFKQDITEYKDTDKELLIPGFQNQVPAKILPSGMLDKRRTFFLDMYIARRIRGSKGIIVNTFMELETNPIKALLSDGKNPPVYPIGPLINLKHHSDEDESIRRWLDNQPVSSVVFLCFGSWGRFGEEQVKEIAAALERSGYRFLWSLRRPPTDGTVGSPNDYENPEEVLPPGFLERTRGIGKVIGWAPQVAVLSHPAVGG
ncbi:putative UDP-glucose flavonoid 3-O-glucosyltransferase 3, partial [Olea europaea var. sylvestris]